MGPSVLPAPRLLPLIERTSRAPRSSQRLVWGDPMGKAQFFPSVAGTFSGLGEVRLA